MYIDQKTYTDKKDNISPEALQYLQEMKVKDVIELASVIAKKSAAEKIFSDAQLFYNLSFEINNIPGSQRDLRDSLPAWKINQLKAIKERLEHLTPDLLPPKVFQDKVVIYPIDIGEQPK